MSATVEAPRELMEELANLRFPATSNERLQELMDLNNEGRLSPDQRRDLAAYAELSEQMALLRAQALKALGRQPV